MQVVQGGRRNRGSRRRRYRRARGRYPWWRAVSVDVRTREGLMAGSGFADTNSKSMGSIRGLAVEEVRRTSEGGRTLDI